MDLHTKHDIQVVSNILVFQRDPHGRVLRSSVRRGHNVLTLTGKEYLSELVALSAVTPSRTPVRTDRIYYMGLGNGSQAEVSTVSALTSPVEYRSGEFLAPVQTPATFPADAVSGTRTSVRFIREFARNEVSLGVDKIITEAGLYTDGDPSNNDIPPAPTAFSSAASRAPVAYHSFEPITKFLGFALVFMWDLRYV